MSPAVLLSPAAPILSQAPAAPLEITFEHERFEEAWTTRQGLPQNTVNAIEESRTGYLWIATLGGLARFDGARFSRFTVENSPLPTNRLYSLCETRAGDLWIGTEGAGVLRLRDGTFTAFRDNVPEGLIWDVLETADGAVWIAGAGVSRFHEGALEAVLTRPADDARFVANDLCEAPDGTLWMATSSGVLSFANGRIEERPLPAEHQATRSITLDPEGRVLAFANSRMYLFDADGFRDVGRTGVDSVHSAFFDSRGDLWLGGVANTTVLRTGAEGASIDSFELDPNPVRSIPSDRKVYTVTEDRFGNVWLGTDGGGLIRTRRAPFASLSSGPFSPVILSVVGDSAGRGKRDRRRRRVRSCSPARGCSRRPRRRSAKSTVQRTSPVSASRQARTSRMPAT